MTMIIDRFLAIFTGNKWLENSLSSNSPREMNRDLKELRSYLKQVSGKTFSNFSC